MSNKETAYIVLFRGVGGATQLPVETLRAVLSDAGFANVATYINSGNAVLSSPMAGEEVAAKVAALVREKMDFRKSVLVASLEEWEDLIAKNPFPHAVEQPTMLHAFLMEGAPEAKRMAALQEKPRSTETFAIRGRVLYLHTPDGMGRSLFAPKIEPTLKVAMSARNWRSVLALRDMAAAI
ncbi:DUF1697 domain-containing protein [Chelativorans salis]|uniref:DUF1697 domain-containing protein n=1 Tax=Chelativorans salis TaxID=2978478 RepID=A0ABT2LQY6_9HYPH|nr:DUF1697 domain-containing protein [Chelativorans sp. EGI FJ00035]MCT7375768.1 DUF1697 domain-containing protein [Chelativorans sp. EGI FJ00035]